MADLTTANANVFYGLGLHHAVRRKSKVLLFAKDKAEATRALSAALRTVRENWEPKTTAHNLRIIRVAREGRNETVNWALQIEEALSKRANQ